MFRCIWNKREIDEINSRLDHFRSQLTLHKVYRIAQLQNQNYASQASRPDVQGVKASVDAVGLKSDANTEEILRSIAEVRVENSQFHARAIQENTAASVAEASLHHLLKTFLDDHEERLAAGVEKKFRAALTSEMEDIRKSLDQVLRDMKTHQEAEESNLDKHGPGRSQSSQPMSGDGNVDDKASPEALNHQQPIPEPHHHQKCGRQECGHISKENRTVTYRYWWEKKTSLGSFSLQITRFVISNDCGKSTFVYNLKAHLIPSPRWFTTGCSIKYQRFTDPRGRPKLVLQPETYRVLEEDHEVMMTMLLHDDVSLGEMLRTRRLAPSDRDKDGRTLLQVSD